MPDACALKTTTQAPQGRAGAPLQSIIHDPWRRNIKVNLPAPLALTLHLESMILTLSFCVTVRPFVGPVATH
jgi:hypothetical protein